MALQRMTARKARISDIVNGSWVKREGMEPSFVITGSGEKISRARVMGTIVSDFFAEDGNFGSVTLDDGTDTMRAKTFKTVKPLDSFRPGDTVDMVGKVREYNGEIYIIPEVIAKVQDPNMELLRRLELISKARNPPPKRGEDSGEPPKRGEQTGSPSAQEAGPGAGQSFVQGQETGQATPPQAEQATPSEEKTGSTKEEDKAKEEQRKKEEEDSRIRKDILSVIESNPEGVEYGEISQKVQAEESRIESVLNDILAEGICYEPTPGKVKKI